MPISATYSQSFRASGLTIDVARTITADVAPPWSVTLAAAKSGTLSARTDNDTGTLTLGSGHGVTTGQRVDVYWSGGSRRGMTAGSVSGNDVPVDGGAGDNLPASTTAVTAMVPDEETIAVPGDDLVAIAVKCPQGGIVVFADSSDAELFAVTRTSANPNFVLSTDDSDNPLAGVTVAKVFLSHGNSTQSSTLEGVVMYN